MQMQRIRAEALQSKQRITEIKMNEWYQASYRENMELLYRKSLNIIKINIEKRKYNCIENQRI